MHLLYCSYAHTINIRRGRRSPRFRARTGLAGTKRGPLSEKPAKNKRKRPHSVKICDRRPGPSRGECNTMRNILHSKCCIFGLLKTATKNTGIQEREDVRRPTTRTRRQQAAARQTVLQKVHADKCDPPPTVRRIFKPTRRK